MGDWGGGAVTGLSRPGEVRALSVQRPQSEEAEDDHGQTNGEKHPLPPVSGDKHRAGTQYQDDHGLDGDAGVGAGE